MIWWIDRKLGDGASKLVKVYQKTLSPDHGIFKHKRPFGYCRYTPTCSQYAVEAYEKKGFFRGSIKSAWRVLRCNPWSKGGWDPVDKTKK